MCNYFCSSYEDSILCDVTMRRCETIYMAGNNFYNSSRLSCRIEEFKVGLFSRSNYFYNFFCWDLRRTNPVNIIWRLSSFTGGGRLCVQPTNGAQEYQTCIDTALSAYQITHWSSGDLEIHFLCPEKFTLGQCRIRTKDL